MSGAMASTVPAKSQPLHNFNLPHLKWNKDGHSSGHNHRRRSIKSPLRRPNPSSASPLRHSPLRDSVSAQSTHRQSPLRDSASPLPLESLDNLVKQSPIRGGESSKPSPVREWVKHSPIGGDSAKQSPNRGDSVRQLPKRDFTSESEALRKNKGGLIEYKRNHTRNSACESIKNGVYASTSERAMEKSEKKQVTEVDAAGINKSKILIKIPCKNKSDEDNTLDDPQQIDNNDEDDVTDEVEEEGKTNNNDEEPKTWNLRPRRPISKCLTVNGAGVKINGAAMPDKNKAQSPLRNVTNRSGENEGNCGGGGGEKKEKRKLSISIALSKVEIEEDIFSLTGSKPARRPKKRAKNVQKQVDYVFPGMWLISITPDLYKVTENYLKG